MTVKELKEALEAYPDNMDVTISKPNDEFIERERLLLYSMNCYNLLVITYEEED